MHSAEGGTGKVPAERGHSCWPCSPHGWGSLLQGAAPTPETKALPRSPAPAPQSLRLPKLHKSAKPG